MSFLEQMGLLNPTIIKKINLKRNILEHRYKTPEIEDVADALDIISIFIGYCEQYKIPNSIGITIHDNERYILNLDREKCIIEVHRDEDFHNTGNDTPLFLVTYEDDIYLDIINFFWKQ